MWWWTSYNILFAGVVYKSRWLGPRQRQPETQHSKPTRRIPYTMTYLPTYLPTHRHPVVPAHGSGHHRRSIKTHSDPFHDKTRPRGSIRRRRARSMSYGYLQSSIYFIFFLSRSIVVNRRTLYGSVREPEKTSIFITAIKILNIIDGMAV